MTPIPDDVLPRGDRDEGPDRELDLKTMQELYALCTKFHRPLSTGGWAEEDEHGVVSIFDGRGSLVAQMPRATYESYRKGGEDAEAER